MTSATIADYADQIAAAGRLLSTARRILFLTGALIMAVNLYLTIRHGEAEKPAADVALAPAE